MTVREFINHLNPEHVLNGKIAFKVIKQSGFGDKWFFFADKKENPEEDTIEKFCNNDRIKGCMNLEICDDGYPVVCFPEWEPGVMHLHIDAYDPAELEDK